MPITRRVLIAAAATAIASAAAAAPIKATQTVADQAVLSKVRIYTIKTHKSRVEVESILRALTASHSSGAMQGGFSSIVKEGAPLSTSGHDDLLARIGKVDHVMDARMMSENGKQIPLSVGRDFSYVKSVEIVDGKRRNEVKDVIRTGLTLDVKPTIRRDGGVDVAVAHQVTEIDNMVDFDSKDAVNRLPRIRKAAAVFQASLQKGQSILHAKYGAPDLDDVLGAQTILVTLITPEIV